MTEKKNEKKADKWYNDFKASVSPRTYYVNSKNLSVEIIPPEHEEWSDCAFCGRSTVAIARITDNNDDPNYCIDCLRFFLQVFEKSGIAK